MKTIAQHLEMMQRLLREMTQYFVTGFPIFCRCTYVCWYFTIVVQCLIVCYLDSIIPMVSLFNVNHVLYSAGWFESLISPKHPRRFSCYTAVIVVEILYT